MTRPLPRGPHELSREEVERSQRERMLAAMTDAVAEKGYVRTSVADVIGRAGVSRATFYAQFTDKEDCFRVAFQEIASLMAVVLEEEMHTVSRSSPDADPIELLDGILGNYLGLLAQAPALAKTFLIEVYAAGPRAIEQRRASLERFVDLVVEVFRGRDGLLGDRPEQRFAAEALVGAVASMVTNMVGAGETDQLLTLREPMLTLVRQLTASS